MTRIKETAKQQLTVLLPNDINYGHTIDEAEKVNAISNAMEKYAKQMAVDFLESIRDYEIENGQRICFDERTSAELYDLHINRA